MADPTPTAAVVQPTIRKQPRHPALEHSSTGGTILRLDDVLIVRGTYGTWLLDVQIDVGVDRVRLQVPIGRHKALDRLASRLARAEAKERYPRPADASTMTGSRARSASSHPPRR